MWDCAKMKKRVVAWIDPLGNLFIVRGTHIPSSIWETRLSCVLCAMASWTWRHSKVKEIVGLYIIKTGLMRRLRFPININRSLGGAFIKDVWPRSRFSDPFPICPRVVPRLPGVIQHHPPSDVWLFNFLWTENHHIRMYIYDFKHMITYSQTPEN